MWRLTFYQLLMDAEILAMRPAKTILTSFKRVGIPDRQIVRKANLSRTDHTASEIVSNKKVMKAARD